MQSLDFKVTIDSVILREFCLFSGLESATLHQGKCRRSLKADVVQTPITAVLMCIVDNFQVFYGEHSMSGKYERAFPWSLLIRSTCQVAFKRCIEIRGDYAVTYNNRESCNAIYQSSS